MKNFYPAFSDLVILSEKSVLFSKSSFEYLLHPQPQ
jgi:hypothetical protein